MEEIFLTNKKINNVKVCLLSDIHYSNLFNIRIFDNILEQIEIIKPNYIFIVGDLVDNTDVNYDVLYSFLYKLEKYGKIFICLGNHDIYKYKGNKKYRSIIDLIKNSWLESNYDKLKFIINNLSNTFLLDNKSYIDKDNNICITGINLSYNYYQNHEAMELFEKEIKKINIKNNSKYYNVLLIHSPYNVYKNIEILKSYDLVISGHMHAGLVHPIFARFFKNNYGFVSPRGGLFPNYVRGRVKTKYFEGYIYEGITKLSESSSRFLHFFDRLFPKKVGYLKINKIDTK